MAGFCAAPSSDLGLVRGLLGTVDCNIRVMSEAGYHAVTGPNSQLAFALTAMLTIYVAVFGLRLMMGLAPLRIGDLTVSALKIGLILALATSWPTYQQVVFDVLFRGPEQVAASMMGAMQPPGSLLGGNPFDGLQVAYDQLQAAAAFFARITLPTSSPLLGGVGGTAFSMNLSSFLMMLTTLGVVLAAKIVLGLLLALGPIFVAMLLFDSTRGVFEGWLRACLAFAFAPLFAILALTVQLTLIEPHLIALADMRATGEVDIPAATAVFILTVVSASVSVAGIVGIFIIALGFKLPRRARTPSAQDRSDSRSLDAGKSTPTAANPRSASEPAQARVAAITAAAAAMERRDLRVIQGGGGPHRLSVGGRPDAATSGQRQPVAQAYRRSAQPRRAASSVRRDR